MATGSLLGRIMNEGSDDTDNGTEDLSCRVCSAPLSYSGRGPKPQFCSQHKRGRKTSPRITSATTSSADVDAACKCMQGMYDELASLLVMSPVALLIFQEKRTKLEERNAILFAINPALCARVISIAAKGSTLSFLFMHLAIIGPVAFLAYKDVMSPSAPKTNDGGLFAGFAQSANNGHGGPDLSAFLNGEHA